MKRLLVTCEYPPITGGQGSYFQNLWADLDPAEHVLLVPAVCRGERQKSPATRFRFMHIPAGERWPPRILRMAGLLLAMLHAALTLRPREIHVGQLIVGGACALLVRLLLRIPYCVHCHGADLLEFSRYGWARPAIRAILAKSRRIIANSSYTAGRIRELYAPPVPIAVVNPCTEDRFFCHDEQLTSALKRQYGLEGKRVLVTVGRLVERKGHDVVLQSLPQLREQIPAIHYLIVGDGPYRSRLEALVQECGVSDMVTFTGRVDWRQLPSFYRLGEAFVMIPRLLQDKGDVEGFGIVYIEANAAGLPVVASRSGGITDAVQEGTSGFLVNDPTDCDELARTIGKLLADPQLYRSLCSSAVQWAQGFSRQAQKIHWHSQVQ